MLLELAQAADETSGAYSAGKIVGVVLIVLLIVLFVRSRLNKDD